MRKVDVVYGNSQAGELHFEGELEFLDASGGQNVLCDLKDAVFTAMASPIEFPAVELAIVPGDRVVLAVDTTVPRLAEVIANVMAYLQTHGVEAEQFSVVLTGQAQVDLASLSQQLPGNVSVEVHDADDHAKVAYVAANKQGEPIYMNRTLVDADVVIPIMCARGRRAIDYEGAYGVFPLLTDRRTRGQFYSLRHLADASEHRHLTEWADEAAWWVGLQIAIQVIPGRDGGIAKILAGDPQALESNVQATMTELWGPQVDKTFDCVVALIDGGSTQQSWDSVARVLSSASPLVRADGALIICSQLDQRPGRALHRLSDSMRSEDTLARQLSSDPADDALAAAVLLQSLENCHVYLLSQLPVEVVESLGVGALQDLNQADHILQQRSSCLIIASAQHSVPEVMETSAAPKPKGNGGR